LEPNPITYQKEHSKLIFPFKNVIGIYYSIWVVISRYLFKIIRFYLFLFSDFISLTQLILSTCSILTDRMDIIQNKIFLTILEKNNFLSFNDLFVFFCIAYTIENAKETELEYILDNIQNQLCPVNLTGSLIFHKIILLNI
jgi:hypothetical protein